jgi:SMC interacting uncharacterized protein involved in chromosome segregation
MSLIYSLDEFKAKLKKCNDSVEMRFAYAAVSNQLLTFKKEAENLRRDLEEKQMIRRMDQINLAAGSNADPSQSDEMSKQIQSIRCKIEEMEGRISSVNLEEYKAAMMDRAREVAGNKC